MNGKWRVMYNSIVFSLQYPLLKSLIYVVTGCSLQPSFNPNRSLETKQKMLGNNAIARIFEHCALMIDLGLTPKRLQLDGHFASSGLGRIIEGGISGAHEETEEVESHLVVSAYLLPCLAFVETVGEGSDVTTWIEVARHDKADILEARVRDGYAVRFLAFHVRYRLGVIAQTDVFLGENEVRLLAFLLHGQHSCVAIECRQTYAVAVLDT